MSVTRKKEPAAFGIRPKTAKALADPWRLRILTEVCIRPLSPSQFVESFGGELTYISRCFRQLADWDYIEVAEERPGRRRGAAIEHIYRATQRAYFDTSTWGGVPRNDRDRASRLVLRVYRQHVRAAVEAGTFDQEADRHLSWDAVVLDRTAWEQLGERLDAILDSLAKHELQAAERLTGASRGQIPTVVGLMAFRSPGSASMMLQGAYRQAGLGAQEPEPLNITTPKLAKALSNRWRCQILSEVCVRPLSPSQFVEEFGGSMTHISRCFRKLADWKLLEVHEERKGGRRGGGVERVYRSTHRPYFDTPTWEALPLIIRDEISRFILDTYFARVAEAVESGTFDAEIDRHLSWKPIIIDRPAWAEICQSLDQVLAWLPELETQSLDRTQDVEALIPATVGLASFRSPDR